MPGGRRGLRRRPVRGGAYRRKAGGRRGFLARAVRRGGRRCQGSARYCRLAALPALAAPAGGGEAARCCREQACCNVAVVAGAGGGEAARCCRDLIAAHRRAGWRGAGGGEAARCCRPWAQRPYVTAGARAVAREWGGGVVAAAACRRAPPDRKRCEGVFRSVLRGAWPANSWRAAVQAIGMDGALRAEAGARAGLDGACDG